MRVRNLIYMYIVPHGTEPANNNGLRENEKNEGMKFGLHVYCASWDRTSKYLDPSFDELRDVSGLKIHQSVWIRNSVSVIQ